MNLPHYPLSNDGCNDSHKINANYAEIIAHTHYRHICIPIADSAAVAVGDGTTPVTIPYEMNGWRLTDVIASVHNAGVTGSTTIQVRRRRAGIDADLLTTKLSFATEVFVRNGVIDTTKKVIATGDQFYVDVDTVHSGSAPVGPGSATLTFEGA